MWPENGRGTSSSPPSPPASLSPKPPSRSRWSRRHSRPPPSTSRALPARPWPRVRPCCSEPWRVTPGSPRSTLQERGLSQGTAWPAAPTCSAPRGRARSGRAWRCAWCPAAPCARSSSPGCRAGPGWDRMPAPAPSCASPARSVSPSRRSRAASTWPHTCAAGGWRASCRPGRLWPPDDGGADRPGSWTPHENAASARLPRAFSAGRRRWRAGWCSARTS